MDPTASDDDNAQHSHYGHCLTGATSFSTNRGRASGGSHAEFQTRSKVVALLTGVVGCGFRYFANLLPDSIRRTGWCCRLRCDCRRRRCRDHRERHRATAAAASLSERASSAARFASLAPGRLAGVDGGSLRWRRRLEDPPGEGLIVARSSSQAERASSTQFAYRDR